MVGQVGLMAGGILLIIFGLLAGLLAFTVLSEDWGKHDLKAIFSVFIMLALLIAACCIGGGVAMIAQGVHIGNVRSCKFDIRAKNALREVSHQQLISDSYCSLQ